jgi:hypothetical protein
MPWSRGLHGKGSSRHKKLITEIQGRKREKKEKANKAKDAG